MTAPLDDDATAGLLADAMRAEVGAELPPPTLVAGLPARAARRRRARLAAGGVAASVAVAASALTWPGGSAPVPPAGPPSPSPVVSESPAPEPAEYSPPVMEATSLPPGYAFWNEERASSQSSTNPGPGGHWVVVVTYARGVTSAGEPRRPIRVTSYVYPVSFDEVAPGNVDGTGARWVVVGSRRVVRAIGPAGTPEYHWTERRGLDGKVAGARGVTDAELRQVVAGARVRRPVRPASGLERLEPLNGAGVVLAETRGRGSRTIGPFAVPAEFDVLVVCDGGSLRVEIGSLRDITTGCDPEGLATYVVDRTGGVRSVTITLTADEATEWAILVTTSNGPP